ncbi:nuclease-related domain-containing protein [Alkalihalobacillus sp. FSL W8-0930]
MIILKPRKKPLKINALEALTRRLPKEHPKLQSVKQELYRRQIGYRGERSIDFYLDSLSSLKDVYVIHDLRLKGDNGHYFQIDTLIVTPSILIILEIKNLSGSLYLNPLTQQLIRTFQSSEEVLPYPLLQTQMQKHQLKEWITSQKWPLLHIFDFVVVSDPTTRLIADTSNQHLMSQVIHAGRLPEILRKLISSTSSQAVLTQTKLQELVTSFNHHHTESELAIMQEYRLSSQELIKGIFCAQYEAFTVVRFKRSWICKQCNSRNDSAPLQALSDYYLLIHPTLTNRDLRHFLNLTSPQLAYSILKNHCPTSTGTYKDRTYAIPSSLH